MVAELLLVWALPILGKWEHWCCALVSLRVHQQGEKSGFLEISTWFSRLPTPGLRKQGKDNDIFLPANGAVAVFDSDCKASVIGGELMGGDILDNECPWLTDGRWSSTHAELQTTHPKS